VVKRKKNSEIIEWKKERVTVSGAGRGEKKEGGGGM